MLRKIFAISILFGVGYFVPDFLDLDEKMVITESIEHPTLSRCEIQNNRCAVGPYSLELVAGNFGILERTTFTLLRHGRPIKGHILVTSDDNQFGTIQSQKDSAYTEQSQVLIPFCGNPIMNIVLIDEEAAEGLILQPGV
jgi:hypothetical protein